jgi:hypothetical protein
MPKSRQGWVARNMPSATKVAESWCERWANKDLPLPIEEIAAEYGVREIEFCELLSTAGLERRGGAFAVVINKEADGVRFEMKGPIALTRDLCLALSPPLRFTLAHEVAHLILLRLANNDLGRFANQAPALETGCNQIAAALLLPETRLTKELDGRFFDATRLLAAAELFKVSLFTLIIRLGEISTKSKESGDGAVFLLREIERDLIVQASFVTGPMARVRWKKAASGDLSTGLRDLYLPQDTLSRIVAGEMVEEEADVVWHPVAGDVIRCRITSCRIKNSEASTLVGIQVLVEHPCRAT